MDVNSHHRHMPPVFESRTFYGQVIVFLQHHYRGQEFHFAQVQLFERVQLDEFNLAYIPGRLTIRPDTGMTMIETKAIDALLGVVYNSTMNRTYMIDRKATIGGE